MKIVAKLPVLLVLAALPLTGVAEQYRSASPSSKQKASNDRQTLLEMYTQQQALQRELRQLRNQVEVQGNEIERLKGRLRTVTEDLDRRMQQLERGGGAAVPHYQAPSVDGGKPPPPTVMQSSDPAAEKKAYESAFRLMKKGDYNRAARGFRDFLGKYPNSPYAANAQYWIGESNYFVRNFKAALEEFQKVVKQYPNSRKVPDAMLKTGYAHYELKQYDKAREVLNEISIRYPNTRIAISAKSRLALMKKEGH